MQSLLSQGALVAMCALCASGCLLARPIACNDPCGDGGFDASFPDGGDADAGPNDDAGMLDAGMVDAGTVDAGMDTDAGRDSGADAGVDGGGLCGNGLQDVGETGVDCGGACPPCDPRAVSDLLLWLRADDLSPGPVTRWVDREGGVVFSEPTVSPTQGPSPELGQAAVTFTPGSRLLSESPVALAGASALTTVYVLRASTFPGVVMESSGDSRANAGAFFDLVGSGGTGPFDAEHGQTPTTHWRSEFLEQRYRWVASVRDLALTTGESEVFVDGLSSGMSIRDGDVPPPLLDYQWSIGGRADASVPFNGQIAEVIVYRRALTPAELSTLGTYMAARYSL